MNRNKILILDDDEIFLEELQETLVLSGYNAVAVASGEEALNAIRVMHPDVILLDLRMDGLNGFDVAKELHNYPKTSRIPVIAISGTFVKEDELALVHMYGMKHFLKKPFNPLDVIIEIEKALAEAKN